ncbi:uncharacterized protein LOC103576278 [Microplitis demolitor]|uniref:uncharacterized protein LOC103576278 n=1 Tax=Microplitis demolitor TaxID=69319 RepID=UPI0004CDCF68|nr:uncharacterized protein LOC103576278 [Microplitis demolitor]XP_008554651.1 uncharacterized protein LOC103576278 [Microplitis demolitor]XP_008554652.1 uncharacterized protein LOC103576278 [Microplitis demolitor]
MMEISKGLQKEIILVQNKLKNAICDHQVCVGKLKDDPNNVDIRGQIQQIQLQIVSLGRCQKQVVERLRKEVEAYQAQNSNGVKVSVASLLGLTNNNNNINNNYHANSNNNNHITPDNDQAKDDIVQVKVQANGLSKRRRLSKDNCRNGVNKKLRAKETSTPVETLSIDDDVVELLNDNSIEKFNDTDNYTDNDSSTSDKCKPELQQAEFLDTLGLITASNFDKLQNKKAERKRRSRANPQFVCSNWELPTKKKRHSYLQSGNAPQTRQTTARLNGPSPPPPPSLPSSSSSSSNNKVTKSQPGVPKTVPLTSSPPSSSSSSSCSSSLSQSSTSKSLIPAQKPVGKPNILRNLNETVHVSCNKTLENGCSTSQTITSNSNSSKSSPSKAMNIPGLPSSLTIEKIENDVVCINCRSPGILSICDNCSASYHPSCHIISPPPPGQCPKCFEMTQDEERISPIVKKSEELGPASTEARSFEQGREDAEVNKAASGFHKIDATTSNFNPNFGVQQLPTSIQLIPIGSSPLASTSITQSNHSLFAGPLNISNNFISGAGNDNTVAYSPVIINQFPSQQSCIAPYMQSDPRLAYNYGMPIVSPPDSGHQHQHHQHQHHQQHHHHQHHLQHQQHLQQHQHQHQQPHSYLIIKKLSDPCVGGLVTRYQSQPSCPSTISYSLPIQPGPTIVSYPSQQPGQPIINYSIGPIDSGSPASQQLLTTSASASTSGIPIPSSAQAIYEQRITEGHHQAMLYDQFTSGRIIAESAVRNSRQSSGRAVPGLNRILPLEPPASAPAAKNPSAPAGPAERKRRKYNVRKARDKKQSARSEPVETKSDSIDETITAVVQPDNQPFSPVNSSNNQPNNVPDSTQPGGLSDIKSGSIVERLYRRLTEDQLEAPSASAGALQTGQPDGAEPSEHLKLEEAHLSAPSSANLVSHTIIIDDNKPSKVYSFSLPNNDRPQSCPSVQVPLDSNADDSDNKSKCFKIVPRQGRRSLDSLQADLTNACRRWAAGRSDEHNDSNKEAESVKIDNVKRDLFNPSITEDTLTADEGDDLEPPGDNQQLDDNDNGPVEPEDQEEEEEEEEEEASDSPDNIDDEAIVSSIDMTVLEDFESAMRQVEVERGTADS